MRQNRKAEIAMNTPPIVSAQEWEAARQQLLVKEKEVTRSRDALAASRRLHRRLSGSARRWSRPGSGV